MTSPRRARNALDEALANIETAHEIHQVIRQKINADPKLSAVGKQDAHRSARADALAVIGRHQDAARTALANLEAALAEEPPPPDGIEGVASRIEAADARQRVRSLLGDGVKPETIIDRASSMADLHTLDALRTEAQWLGASDNPSGLAGQDQAGVDGLLQRIDAARLPLLPPDVADRVQQRAELASQRDALLAKIDRASREVDTGPSLEGAIADRLGGLTEAPAAEATGGDAGPGGEGGESATGTGGAR